MADDNKSFQSNLTEKQYTLVKLEILLDEMINTLGTVKTDALDGRISRSYPTLKQQYMNVLLRTGCIGNVSTAEYMLTKEDKVESLCRKAENYIRHLQRNGIYNLGREDFGI